MGGHCLSELSVSQVMRKLEGYGGEHKAGKWAKEVVIKIRREVHQEQLQCFVPVQRD